MGDVHRALYYRLVEVLGADHAETLMSHIPSHETASKADIGAFRAELKADVAAVKTDVDELKGEISRRFESLEGRFDGLRKDVYDQGLRNEAQFGQHGNEFQESLRSQTRLFISSSLGSSALIAGGIVGAAALL